MAQALTTLAELDTALPEASDVVLLPGNRFLVVSDKVARGVIVGPSTPAIGVPLPELPKKNAGLEAVAFDGKTGTVYAVVEELNRLLAYAWNHDAPTFLWDLTFAFPAPHEQAGSDNDGVEGILHFAASESPLGVEGFVLAKEKKPPLLYHLRQGETTLEPIAIDAQLTSSCADFAGLAFDHVRGTVLLVSEASSCLAELELSAANGKLSARTLEVYPLVERIKEKKGKTVQQGMDRVEGVVVDEAGGWWVLLEDSGVLRRVR